MLKLKLNEPSCTGCRSCEIVCALHHYKENNPHKSALRVHGKFPSPGAYSLRFCTQCGKCAEVCKPGAIVEKKGIYKLYPDKCNGCLACIQVCPEDVLFLSGDSRVPIKCDWCGECMRICPRAVISLKSA